MIKTIIPTIFAIYSLSSANRILLQTGVADPAPAVPAIPPPPEPVIPSEAVPGVQEPIPSTGGGGGGGAVEPTTGSAVEPGTATGTVEPPTGGAAGGGAVEPGAGAGNAGNAGNAAGGLPWTQTGGSGTAGVKTECTITPPAKGSCAQHPMIVSNPDFNWELHSNGLGAMYQSQVTIDISPTSLLEEIAGFYFTAGYAGYEAVITINNPTGRAIGIAACDCTEDYSCSNMVIYTGPDVFIEAGDFYCDPQKIGACDNCWVKENAADVGMPCTSYA